MVYSNGFVKSPRGYYTLYSLIFLVISSFEASSQCLPAWGVEA